MVGQGVEYPRERVFAHAPPPELEDRPNSALYSLGSPLPAEPTFYPSSPSHQAFPPAYAPSYPLESRSAPAQASSVSNPTLRVKFNYRPQFQSQLSPQIRPQLSPQVLLPPPQLFQGYASPSSPICELASPTPAGLGGNKVALIPEQSDRIEERQEEKFDAKLVLSSSLKNLLSHNNKLVYSDSTSTYELDEELAEDMVRYLNGEP